MNNLNVYKAFEPDPIEWTYYMVALLCKGRLEEATIRSEQFPLLHHPELDRIRWAIAYLQGKGGRTLPLHDQPSSYRSSIHILPQQKLVGWVHYLCVLLKACRQYAYAHLLENALCEDVLLAKRSKAKVAFLRFFKRGWIRTRIHCSQKVGRLIKLSYLQNPKRGSPPVSQIKYFIQLSGSAKMEIAKRVLKSYAYRLNVPARLFTRFQRQENTKERVLS